MSTDFDLDGALQTIIQNKTFKQDSEKWARILSLIPKRIREIILSDYLEELTSEVKDPLNSTKIETLDAFIDRLSNYLETTFPQNPPFTIVRLAELLQSPKQYNSTGAKFLRAIENVIQISSSISDFPEPTVESTIKFESEASGATKEEVVPVSIGSDDSQTILLTKIPWLTEDDIKEIESDSYLIEEYPISAQTSQDEFDSDEHPIDHENQSSSEQESEVDRKRQLEGSKDSPEKKHKTEHTEDGEEDTSTIGNDTLDEDRGETGIADTTVGDATVGDTSIADTSIADTTVGDATIDNEHNNEQTAETGNDTLTEASNEQSEEKEETQSEDVPKEISKNITEDKKDENEDEGNTSNVGNETLEEDKMELD